VVPKDDDDDEACITRAAFISPTKCRSTPRHAGPALKSGQRMDDVWHGDGVMTRRIKTDGTPRRRPRQHCQSCDGIADYIYRFSARLAA
jgi:hypothetical protein